MKHEYYTCDRCGRKVNIAYRLYAVGGDESKPLADIDLCSDCLYEVKDLITRPVDQTEKVPRSCCRSRRGPTFRRNREAIDRFGQRLRELELGTVTNKVSYYLRRYSD